MHLKTRNVNSAFRELVQLFHERPTPNQIFRRESRNGPVLMIDEPVTITYTHPRERVMFNAARDANPFLHLYEALWMLAGRNDVAPLAYYCGRMKEFSDDGKTLNGAYGYRWRRHYDYYVNEVGGNGPHTDQLDILVNHLKADPSSRRTVLQMWNIEDDLLKIGKSNYPCCEAVQRIERVAGDRTTLSGGQCPIHGRTYHDPASKDVCCNLSVMFSLRNTDPTTLGKQDPLPRPSLDMTVTNRSNDLIWGLLGTNYVHFTILQEYMAARLGVEVGLYHHFTNNLHVYADRPDWKPAELLADTEGDYYHYVRHDLGGRVDTPETVPLVRDAAAFEAELPRFVQYHSSGVFAPVDQTWSEPFLREVAEPMLMAFHAYKRQAANTTLWAERIAADDWRIAATSWVERRLDHARERQADRR